MAKRQGLERPQPLLDGARSGRNIVQDMLEAATAACDCCSLDVPLL